MKTENYLRDIDQKLTRATAEKDHHVPAERLAEGISEVLKGFLDGVEGAEKVRQNDLKRIAQFKGSPAYASEEASANEVYSRSVAGLASASKKAVKDAVRALRERYQSGELQEIPEPVMQQLQLFNMLKHPAASQYQHFERIFRKYPQVQEVLVNKYNFDKDSDPSYVPKFESGAVFEPYTPLSDASVQQKLDSLLRSSYSLVDATVEGNSAIESQIAKNVKNAKDPVETIRATCSWGTPETQEFLGTVDRNFAPGESETSPEDAAVEAYENDRAYTAEVKAGQADPAIQQKALDYYTK